MVPGAQLRLELNYRPDLSSPGEAQAHRGRLLRLLESIAAPVDLPLSRLSAARRGGTRHDPAHLGRRRRARADERW